MDSKYAVWEGLVRHSPTDGGGRLSPPLDILSERGRGYNPAPTTKEAGGCRLQVRQGDLPAGERLHPLPPPLFAAAKPPPRIVIASHAEGAAWQSRALRFGLADRHGAASADAAPRDDMMINRSG